jgi:hypothetical protein
MHVCVVPTHTYAAILKATIAHVANAQTVYLHACTAHAAKSVRKDGSCATNGLHMLTVALMQYSAVQVATGPALLHY